MNMPESSGVFENWVGTWTLISWIDICSHIRRRHGSGSITDVDGFAGFESSYITFTQFLQGGLKMPESYYSEYQEVKVQASHSNVNSRSGCFLLTASFFYSCNNHLCSTFQCAQILFEETSVARGL